jgi:hypothetical protein
MQYFLDKIFPILVDKLGIGLLILISGYYLNRFLERYKGEQALKKEYESLRDKTSLQHLQRQIEEFYSPLLGLIQHAGIIYNIAKMKSPLGRHDPNHETWEYFVEKYFLNLNSQMADLIRTKIYLLESDELPESFQQFLTHSTEFDSLYTLWKDKKVSSDEVRITHWPTAFESDVKDSLDKLRRNYNDNLKRLKNAT